MARGRRPIPDAIKAAKGNPGKRKLMIQGAAQVETEPQEAPGVLKRPDHLTTATERATWSRVCEMLATRRIVRETDLDALGRWCAYMAKWIEAKKQLGRKHSYYETKSKHGKLLRVHPLHVIMRDMERMLLPLEDRLGLSPAARQTILRGMMLTPKQGDMFPGDTPPPKPEGEGDVPAAAAADAADDQSALAFLRNADTRH